MSEVVSSVAYLEAPGKLSFREERLRPPGPGELLCQTLDSIISPGTELAAWSGLPPLRPGTAYPRVTGYCNVSVVVAVGSRVLNVAPGMRILSFASHRSYFLLPVDQLLLILDERMDSVATASTYLFHLGYNAMLRAGVRAGSRVLVIGLGALGLTSVAMATVAGADVQVISAREQTASIAKEYGARAVYGRQDLEALIDAWRGERADVVVSTTGAWSDWRLALQAAARFGTIAVLGFPGRGELAADFNPLDSQFFYDKQLRIEAVGMSPSQPDTRGFLRFNERDNLRYLANLIAIGRLLPERIISGRYAGRDLAEAYSALAERRGSSVTFALEWHR